MRELFGIEGSYQARCEQLISNRIALWDVLASSYRPGSMDADIRLDTAMPNDFERFFFEHGDIELIAFNGKAAARFFHRFVADDAVPAGVARASLPSTSPAFATMQFSGKLSAWRAAIS